MNTINSYITEKLKLGKNTKVSTEDVLVFDKKIEFSLFLTGLNRISKDNGNCQDIAIYHSGDFYKFTKNPKQGSIVITPGDKQLSICEIVLYKIDQNEDGINRDVVDNIISELTEWNKTKKRKYLEFVYSDDDILPKSSKKYIYMWYSNTFEVIMIYTSDDSYEELKDKNVFQ